MSCELSLIFDGTTRCGEAIVVLVRFVDDQWTVQQRLVRLDVVAKSVNAEELARVLQACLIDFTIHGHRVLGCTRDGVAVNGAALEKLQIFCPKMVQITCVSHTLDNVGERFDTPTVDEFGQLWTSLFAHSSKAKLLWQQLTGTTMKSYSAT